MYAYELTVNSIAKRDIIFAVANKEVKLNNFTFLKGDQIFAWGHWDTAEGIYCQVYELNNQLIEHKVALDVMLDFNDWEIKVQALVDFKKKMDT